MKTRLKRPRNSLGEIPTQIKSKSGCWKLSENSDCCRSTGPVDRQRSDFRPLGRRSIGPVDRSPKQRVSSLCRSIGLVDRGKTESTALVLGRPVGRPSTVGFPTVEKPVDRDGRPKSQPESKFSVGRPVRSTGEKQRALTMLPVDRSVDRCAPVSYTHLTLPTIYSV